MALPVLSVFAVDLFPFLLLAGPDCRPPLELAERDRRLLQYSVPTYLTYWTSSSSFAALVHLPFFRPFVFAVIFASPVFSGRCPVPFSHPPTNYSDPAKATQPNPPVTAAPLIGRCGFHSGRQVDKIKPSGRLHQRKRDFFSCFGARVSPSHTVDSLAGLLTPSTWHRSTLYGTVGQLFQLSARRTFWVPQFEPPKPAPAPIGNDQQGTSSRQVSGVPFQRVQVPLQRSRIPLPAALRHCVSTGAATLTKVHHTLRTPHAHEVLRTRCSTVLTLRTPPRAAAE